MGYILREAKNTQRIRITSERKMCRQQLLRLKSLEK